ncbi:hypothetical protein KY284_005111 [Solanum tuberosum]|nr:hypothetical protein KY284_005111 [Solanum tuberosum]
MISNDPILRGVKLIAEAWDCGGLYQVGMFQHWGIWSEWNGKVEILTEFINALKFLHVVVYEANLECESLGSDGFPTAERLQRHGHTPRTPDWSEESRFIAFTLVDKVKGQLYIAFNANHLPVTITLPERPGYRWQPLVDTGKPAPFNYLTDDVPERETEAKQYSHFLDANQYPMLSYSSIILLLSSADDA